MRRLLVVALLVALDRELARAREDFAFESTLAGRSAHRLLKGLVGVGYDVHIFYLWLPSPDLAVARVRRRVEAGGHDVAEHVIRRRFWKSLVNFDGTPVVLDDAKWREIRKRIAEVA